MSLNQEEEEYIERLYREMYTRLCIYAMSALGSKALAEEVVQDTFRIACIKPDGLMSSKNPRGWLINTLKNVIRNRRRTEARLSNALLAAMSAYEPQASTTVETTEFIVAYSDALGEEDFQLLVNIVVRRYTMLEAAEELGITVEACKKRVQRAKKNYRFASSEGCSLFDFDDEPQLNGTSDKTQILRPAPRSNTRPRKWVLRTARILAAVIAVLLATSLTAYAFGFDLWGAIASWTKETFGFRSAEYTQTAVPSSKKEIPAPLTSIANEMEMHGIPSTIAICLRRCITAAVFSWSLANISITAKQLSVVFVSYRVLL